PRSPCRPRRPGIPAGDCRRPARRKPLGPRRPGAARQRSPRPGPRWGRRRAMRHFGERLLDVEIGVVLLIVAGGAYALDDAERALIGDAVDGGLLQGGRRLDVVVAGTVA